VRTICPEPSDRPLCCGRTFLAEGLVDEARIEAKRMLAALKPFVDAGVPIVGLEPSCLLTLRDEYLALGLGPEAEALAGRAMLFEEYLAGEAHAGRLADLRFTDQAGREALLHGHCHQKAFGALGAVESTLKLVPGLAVKTIASSCCGMAGSFGYEPEYQQASLAMAERDVLPAIRAAKPGTLIVADGTSCRHQIAPVAEARHVARVLAEALAPRDPR